MASSRPLIVTLCGALCACAAPAPQLSTAVCPPTVSYTPSEEAEIYTDLMALPPGSVLRKVADEDYHLRLLAKACRSSK